MRSFSSLRIITLVVALFALRRILTSSFTLSLVILGNHTEFEKAVLWLSENLSFDVDARINLFEVTKQLYVLAFKDNLNLIADNLI